MNKKRVLSILLCLIVLLTACNYNISIAEAYHIDYGEEQFRYSDLRLLEERINQMSDRMDAAHSMAEAARSLGYNDSHDIIELAKKEYQDALNSKQEYKMIHKNLTSRWEEKEREYPVAAYVWKTLSNAGYSDIVIAGILGNMMVEVGGYTLELQWWLKDSYYGLCQWSKGYPEVWGASLEQQVQFLLSTIKYELDTYGYMYRKGTNYESFLLMDDISQAAKCFAASYERCGSSTYDLRQKLAIEAYNYFVT